MCLQSPNRNSAAGREFARSLCALPLDCLAKLSRRRHKIAHCASVKRLPGKVFCKENHKKTKILLFSSLDNYRPRWFTSH